MKRRILLIVTAFSIFVSLLMPNTIIAETDPPQSTLIITGSAPTPVADFTYDGHPHDLVTGGSLGISGGNGFIEYGVNDSWGTGISQVETANTYHIQYRGVDETQQVFAGPFEIGTVTVKPALNAFTTTPVPASGFEFDGQAHPLYTTGGAATFGNKVMYYYSYNDGAYMQSENIPTIKNAGTYKFYCEAPSLVPNYTGERTSVETITVTPKPISDVTFATTDLTYNASSQTTTISNVVSTSVGTLSQGTDYKIVTGTDTATNAGNYTAKIEGIGNYAFTTTAAFKISPLDITGATINLGPELTYTGYPQTKSITSVVKSGVTLPTTDYTVTGATQTDVGNNYTLTIAGKSPNTTGSATATWEIKPFTITNDNVDIVLGPQLTYNEHQQTQSVLQVKAKATGAVINPSQYTISGNTGTDSGNYTLTITGKNNISGSATKDWTINKCTVTGSWSGGSFPYDGSTHSVYLTGLPSCASVSYSGNSASEPGVYTAYATITITGNDNYTAGSVPALRWEIYKPSYDMSGVKFLSKAFAYDGKPHSIAITGTLPAGVTVTYLNNSLTNVGTKKVTAVFTGDNFHAPIPNMYANIKILNELVPIPAKDETIFIENGQEQTYQIPENKYYKFEGNVQKDAGRYQVIVSLLKPENTAWEDGTNEDKVYEFVIRRKELTDNNLYTITSDKGIDPDAKATIKYTEKTDDSDYKHIVTIDSILGAHEHFRFGYLINIDGETVEGPITITLKLDPKFKDYDLKAVHVHDEKEIKEIPFTKSKDGKTITITVDKLSEFVFIGEQKGFGTDIGDEIHKAKGIVIGAFTLLATLTYIISKRKRFNFFVLLLMAAYGYCYTYIGYYFNCDICLVIDACAVVVLLFFLILFLKKKKNKKDDNNNEPKDPKPDDPSNKAEEVKTENVQPIEEVPSTSQETVEQPETVETTEAPVVEEPVQEVEEQPIIDPQEIIDDVNSEETKVETVEVKEDIVQTPQQNIKKKNKKNKNPRFTLIQHYKN